MKKNEFAELVLLDIKDTPQQSLRSEDFVEAWYAELKRVYTEVQKQYILYKNRLSPKAYRSWKKKANVFKQGLMERLTEAKALRKSYRAKSEDQVNKKLEMLLHTLQTCQTEEELWEKREALVDDVLVLVRSKNNHKISC